MVFDDKDSLNEGPVGKVVGGGLEGLGGDMNGYPTGMGAGAEPLGAFGNDETSIMGNGGPQSLDDKSDSFSSEDSSRSFADSSNGESLDAQSVSPQGFPAVQAGPGFSSQFGGLVSAQPYPGSREPQARAVSMSNSLSDIDDKVNVQGDGEIGKMILAQRLHQKNKETREQQEPSTDSQTSELESDYSQGGEALDAKNYASYSPNIGLAMNDENFSNEEEELAGKRRLQKQKPKRKSRWNKPFKKLQNHKH